MTYNGDSYGNESEMTYWGDRDEIDGYYDEEILRYGDLDGRDKGNDIDTKMTNSTT